MSSPILQFFKELFWWKYFISTIFWKFHCQRLESVYWALNHERQNTFQCKCNSTLYITFTYLFFETPGRFQFWTILFSNIMFWNDDAFMGLFVFEHRHGTLEEESTSTFWRLHMGWLFWILETYQRRFEHHWIQKSSLKITP